MADPVCVKCGGTTDVLAVTPDPDIKPVHLCALCRWRIFYTPGGTDADRP